MFRNPDSSKVSFGRTTGLTAIDVAVERGRSSDEEPMFESGKI
jgi:hypothetical protein